MVAREAGTNGKLLAGKASFDHIYEQRDPRAYFSTLGTLEYQIPHHAQRVFRRLLEVGPRPSAEATVTDLCCSYGINTALLRHDLVLDDLYVRYAQAEADSTGDLAARDRRFFHGRRRAKAPRTVGIDRSARAVAYARTAGMLDEGFGEDLESAEPSAALRAAVADTSMVTVTGGVGYITHRTFQRLLDCVRRPPWVAAFVLRGVAYQHIAEVLGKHGLVTEKLPGRTFRQRRFASPEEARTTVSALTSAGIPVRDKESTGYFHTDLYLSRPAGDVAAQPLDRLLAD
ncbi:MULTISPECIES: class I SAM-dependent methyltransferase [unclassified Crossiella]|uniref:class I SAM-dependent methyltransferase n=1 Tax=unclassified Crossiella TaxID=2620835 RepID=UPI001FFED615|nr:MULTISPECIES: class I SAM-dependent methyltransferase [unclassified Crossiella]MCK2240322.1 class I SAM-dependent methyltransferase [Crossiella sp. S99.2]MCK2253226.1 class I SAM-dependent methyltransferase [Crossiella sp. S99.1]